MPLHPEEFTTIKVDLTIEERAVVLVPQDDAASATLQHIIDNAPGSFKLDSGGMAGTHERITGAYLFFGGKHYRRTEGNWTETDYRDSIKVHLDLSDVSSPQAVTRLRGYMWYGIGTDPSATVDTFRLMPAIDCKVCEKPLERLGDMEWLTCDSCAAACDHQFVEGLGRVNGHIAHLPFCNKCGRGDPDWKPSSNPLEDILGTVASGDLTMLALAGPNGQMTIITKQ